MRFAIAIVVLCLAAKYCEAAPSCAATSYCMGCSATASTGCTACFNWGSGSVGAREKSTSTPYTCTAALAIKTTDCKYYTGAQSVGGTSGSCFKCKKDWRNQSVSTTNVTTHTCSNTAINTTTCATKISNCDQMVCNDYVSTGSTDFSKCAWCKKGYWGTIDATTWMYSACTNSGTAPTANCDYYHVTSSTTSGCLICKSNYAVSITNTCVSYTTDKNCRTLQTANTQCSNCWSAYYWNATVCKLSAKVMTTIMMAAIAVLSFFMF